MMMQDYLLWWPTGDTKVLHQTINYTRLLLTHDIFKNMR